MYSLMPYLRKTSAKWKTKPGSFDELALLVLVKKDDEWWLAAAQHVPDRRGVYLMPGTSAPYNYN